MSVEQLSEQLRMVIDRQGALETALIQEQQAGAEAERRLGVALGDVGGRADAAVAAAKAGAASSPVGASSSSMAGCIDTRLLGKLVMEMYSHMDKLLDVISLHSKTIRNPKGLPPIFANQYVVQ